MYALCVYESPNAKNSAHEKTLTFLRCCRKQMPRPLTSKACHPTNKRWLRWKFPNMPCEFYRRYFLKHNNTQPTHWSNASNFPQNKWTTNHKITFRTKHIRMNAQMERNNSLVWLDGEKAGLFAANKCIGQSRSDYVWDWGQRQNTHGDGIKARNKRAASEKESTEMGKST